jgi:glycosyltransferase involved in cell wall biosynthesis
VSDAPAGPAPARISVVVPCHNYGRFLGEALTSLRGQTRPPDEVMVVDDGSTDDTAAVVEQWTRDWPVVQSMHRSPARGPARTFNDGIRASTGDLVMLLSADDRMSPRYLEMTEAALASTGADFAYASEQLFGAVTGWRDAPPFDVDQLMIENPYNGSALMRRSLYDRCGGYREDFDRLGLEDWELWVHAVAVGGRGCPAEECWLEYRRHQAGSRNTIPRLNALRAHLRVWRLHPEAMRPRHLVRWMGRSLVRNARGLAP